MIFKLFFVVCFLNGETEMFKLQFKFCKQVLLHIPESGCYQSAINWLIFKSGLECYFPQLSFVLDITQCGIKHDQVFSSFPELNSFVIQENMNSAAVPSDVSRASFNFCCQPLAIHRIIEHP